MAVIKTIASEEIQGLHQAPAAEISDRMQTSTQSNFFQKKKSTKKRQSYNDDIVYTKHGCLQTMPSLTKRLKAIKEPIIGLQYVWEYRSPSKSVAPHYQCRLCKVQWQQNEMAAHVAGWKHCFKYLKHAHPKKMAYKEEEIGKNPTIKKKVKMAAAEVEKAEGRGQVKVIIREPADVPVFQDMKTAFPPVTGPSPPSLFGSMAGDFLSGGPLSGGFLDPPFSDDFQPRGGMMSDFCDGPDDGPIMSPDRYGPDRMIGVSERRSMHLGSDGFGMGPRSEDMDRSFPDDLPINNSDRMMRSKGPDSNSTLSTLLRCLDTFRIECEDDAQIVLKITQKLTDVLMEYRLRTISSGSSMNSSRLPPSPERFSGSMSGLPRFYN